MLLYERNHLAGNEVHKSGGQISQPGHDVLDSGLHFGTVEPGRQRGQPLFGHVKEWFHYLSRQHAELVFQRRSDAFPRLRLHFHRPGECAQLPLKNAEYLHARCPGFLHGLQLRARFRGHDAHLLQAHGRLAEWLAGLQIGVQPANPEADVVNRLSDGRGGVTDEGQVVHRVQRFAAEYLQVFGSFNNGAGFKRRLGPELKQVSDMLSRLVGIAHQRRELHGRLLQRGVHADALDRRRAETDRQRADTGHGHAAGNRADAFQRAADAV